VDTTKNARRSKREADKAAEAARRFEERLTWKEGNIEILDDGRKGIGKRPGASAKVQREIRKR